MNRTTCPQCARSVAFRDELAGKMARCPHCKNPVRLTLDATQVSAAPTVSVPAPSKTKSTRPIKQPVNKPPATPAKSRRLPFLRVIAVSGLVLGLAGGSFAVYRVLTTQEPTKPVVYDYPIEFHDSVSSNANVADDTLDLTFLDKDGQKLDLKQYRDQKVVVLVVTRGFSGRICAGCTTQTSRLMSNYAEFAKRDAEVLVVFPGPSEYVAEFLQKSQAEQAGTLPFPLLLDREFAAVDRLGIRADLAKPATYIIDKKGRVRFAYVGAHLSDRPSVKAMLEQLDSIAKNP